jgi:NitT/TauT family transport system permease protein
MADGTAFSRLRRRGRASSSAPRKRTVIPARGFAPLLVALAIWQLFGPETAFAFPKPSRWVEQLIALGRTGELWSALAATTWSFVLGLVLATAIGSVLGAIVGRWNAVDRALGPLFEFLRVIPPAAIVPIFVLLWGYEESMKLAIVVFSASWPVLLQVRSQAKRVPPLLLETARSLRFGRVKTLVSFIIPTLVPGIVSGVRLAAPTVLIVVLLVEILTQVPGLGATLSNAQRAYNVAAVYGLTVVAGLLAVLVSLLVTLGAWALRRYRRAR